MPRDSAGNEFRDAQKITLQSKISKFKDWVGATDQEDYFKFRLNKSSNVKLKLTTLKANVSLRLFDRQGNLVAESDRRGRKHEKIKLNTLEAGNYYIRVSQQRGNTKYKLKFKGISHDVTQPNDDTTVSKLHPFIKKVLDLTNVQRALAGLSGLSLDHKLGDAAQSHSERMAVDDFFSHTGRDGSSPFDRIEAEGYQFRTAAENIAAGYSTPEAVVSAWMNSSGHRANILNGDLQEIGIGYYFLENDIGAVNHNSYWTQAFGTPFS